MDVENHASVVSSLTDSSSMSHHTTPTRKNKYSPRLPRPRLRTSLLLLIIFLTCCVSLSSANRIYIEEQMVEDVVVDASEDFGSALDRLAKSGTLLVDLSPPPDPKAWMLATEQDGLQRRGDPSSSSSTQGSSTSSSNSVATSSTTSTATATKTTSTATTDSATPLPSAFDQGFSGNITDSCQSFMTSMLTNKTFISCLPFSLLLQNSRSFFDASKSVVLISQVLDATCAAKPATCSPLMSAFASNITTASSCASDLSAQNPLITDAYTGLLAYNTLYTASCLRNPSTSSYCYADAVTNSSSPTDTYIYYLPLNISLPAGSQPSCNSCLKDTMAVFEAATSDRSSALASDYASAAGQVNVQCGPGFVNASLAAVITSAGRVETANPTAALFSLALLAAYWLL